MKHLTIISAILLTGCVTPSTGVIESESGDYTFETVKTFNTLTPPIVLIAKDKTPGTWGVTLRDSRDSMVYFGDFSGLANQIGASYEVGDTLK